MARVTVVNDNAEFLDMVGDILKDERYTVSLVDGDDPEPLERIRESLPDLLMIDLRLGTDELHGWDVAQQVRRDSALSEVPILLCSADVVALAGVEDHLDETHMTAVLTKPFEINELTETVERLLGEPTAR